MSSPDKIPIFQSGSTYQIFSPTALLHLRRTHRILGVLIGTLPQSPQQNVFLGLPARLLPEEVRLLVSQGAAYIINDPAAHTAALKWLDSPAGKAQRAAWLEELQRLGRDYSRGREAVALSKRDRALAEMDNAQRERAVKALEARERGGLADAADDEIMFPAYEQADSSLLKPQTAPEADGCVITPTESDPPVPIGGPHGEGQGALIPAATKSYPLFRHLHDLPGHTYFLSPGLRFGCNYMVYPGDPLRFHSHFLAVGKEWEEEFDLLSLVGGGRLGTGVKKGFLLGGQVTDQSRPKEEDGPVRVFCIEWGGM